MSKFFGYINPLPLRRRDRAIYAHLRNSSSLTSHQLLGIDYNGFPEELEISAKNNKPVSIKPIFSNSSLGLMKRFSSTIGIAGFVNDPDMADEGKGELAENIDNRTIYLSPAYASAAAPAISAGTMGVIGHLLYQCLALDVSAVHLAPFAVLAATALSSTRHAPFVSLWGYLYQEAMDTIGHEHIHVLQVDDHYNGKTGFNVIRNPFKKHVLNELEATAKIRKQIDSAVNVNTANYYMEDCEVQARLHTVMTHGRPRWGRLPLNRHELWAALVDSGMTAPKSVIVALKSSEDRTHEAFCPLSLKNSFNRTARKFTDKSAAELDAATRAHITPPLKEFFWNETLPHLYGHLLELYGDKRGRELMDCNATNNNNEASKNKAPPKPSGVAP